MKNFIYLSIFLVLMNSCKKNEPLQGLKLDKITLNGKTSSSFEYSPNNILLKEAVFDLCATTPSQESFYVYSGSKLSKARMVARGHFSALSDRCDPNKGMESELSFSYDDQGRIHTVTWPASVTRYVYNQAGLIEKSILKWDNGEAVTSYEYDARGNVIKLTDASGKTSYYVYDNKVNPHYQIKSGMGLLTPFNMSSNNVIKGTGSNNFERKLQYNSDGWPVKVLEDNGLNYIYHYK